MLSTILFLLSQQLETTQYPIAGELADPVVLLVWGRKFKDIRLQQ